MSAENKEMNHIPVSNVEASKEREREQEEEEEPGLLGTILNPVGKGLEATLSPVGAVVGGITKPLANGVGGVTRPALGPVAGKKEERIEVLGGDNRDSWAHTPDKIAGGLQTGDNPLGLDQSGRWGFRKED